MHYPTWPSNQNPGPEGDSDLAGAAAECSRKEAKAPKLGAFASGHAVRVTVDMSMERSIWTIARMAGRRRVRS